MATETPENDTAQNDEAATAAGSNPERPESLDSLDNPESLAELRKKAEERELYRAEFLRAKADLDNYLKRSRRDRPTWEEQAERRVLRDLLPIVDNLERALPHASHGKAQASHLEEGVRLTLQMFLQTLKDHGVEEISAEGEVFNPELHEAVAEVDVPDLPTGRIVEVLEKGYQHRDVVLRPSRVKVARNVKDSSGASASGSGGPGAAQD